ncbi:uncharacterized protein LOC111391624 [Olea europaea var. sylvestris]|uniref:uncharacterized protein LOC111391624 n=1 Tax=Olea europaea var. sylvestris TaxID=158386 RepID=UPI000C1D59EE|nr:uncharacterized protein LOC111391624 [Olea europaea var. sylvestris]
MYSSKSFSCNACGSIGNAFSFSCAHCEFDLHIHCAKLPAKILLEKHPHELNLLFHFPYEDKTVVFECDVCQVKMNRDHWLYYCADCDFAAHLNCATGKVARKEELSSSCNKYLKSATRKVEDIQAVDKAQERVMAARVQALLMAQGRNAALDLI